MKIVEKLKMDIDGKINHPNREMHTLFAESLFECIFEGEANITENYSNTMYKGE